jgi:hypothetical protein
MALMGVLIALPIPFGNTIPGLSVILMSLGLAIGDGLAVLGALNLAILATGILIALAWGARSGITHLLAPKPVKALAFAGKAAAPFRL